VIVTTEDDRHSRNVVHGIPGEPIADAFEADPAALFPVQTGVVDVVVLGKVASRN